LDSSEALKIGLVDKIGGLDDAIVKAASLAKIKLQTQNYQEYEKNFNDLLANFPFAKSKADFIKKRLG
jgi:protease-4